MADKNPLTPEEVTELFSEIDASGVLDPALGCSLLLTHALGSLFGKRGIQDTGCIDFGE